MAQDGWTEPTSEPHDSPWRSSDTCYLGGASHALQLYSSA